MQTLFLFSSDPAPTAKREQVGVDQGDSDDLKVRQKREVAPNPAKTTTDSGTDSRPRNSELVNLEQVGASTSTGTSLETLNSAACQRYCK